MNQQKVLCYCDLFWWCMFQLRGVLVFEFAIEWWKWFEINFLEFWTLKDFILLTLSSFLDSFNSAIIFRTNCSRFVFWTKEQSYSLWFILNDKDYEIRNCPFFEREKSSITVGCNLCSLHLTLFVMRIRNCVRTHLFY